MSPSALQLPTIGTHIVAQLFIDGVVQPGGGLVYDSLNSKGAIIGQGKIQVGQPPANDYETWVISSGVTGPPYEDDDGDGLGNFEEYAFGLVPTSNTSINPITTPLKPRIRSWKEEGTR